MAEETPDRHQLNAALSMARIHVALEGSHVCIGKVPDCHQRDMHHETMVPY